MLRPALRRAVGAEEEVLATAEAVRQGDDGLAALLVKTVFGDVVPAGHVVQPFLRKTSARRKGFGPHFPPREGTFKLSVRQDLCQGWVTGLEPATS